MTGHESLEQLKEETGFFMKWRNPDNISIAGGEPLIQPQIVDLVGTMIVSANQMYGSVSKRTMKLAQAGYHILKSRS